MTQGAVATSPSAAHPQLTTWNETRVALATVVVALVCYAALAVGYMIRTPAWQNPDEPAHFNYVAFVASTGGLPVLQPGDWDSELLERLKNGTLQPTDHIEAIRYESWQPPLFYLAAAPIYRLGAPDTALYRLRALDVALGAFTLVLAYAIARQVMTPLLAAAVPLSIAGVPMFTSVSASLSADPLANLIAAATLLALLKAPFRHWPVATGVLIGLGLLTKLELAIFLPLAALAIARQSARPWRDAAVLLVTAGVLISPWLVHQVTSYGWSDPLATARHSQVVADQMRFPGVSLNWLQQFLTISFHSFWAQFGWMAIVAPDRLYLAWGGITLLALIGLIVDRRWVSGQRWQLLLAAIAVALVAYVGYNLAFVQYQSRYLFTAIVPIAIMLVRGWSTLPPRPWLTFGCAAGLVALNAYALVRVLTPGFAPA